MTIKSSKELVNDALKEIKTISHTEASKLHKDGSCNLIDIRDVRELEKEGRVEGSLHIPRGMLEFWIDPESPYHKEIFGEDKRFIFHCAAGWRSALAVATLNDMGFEAEHISDGFAGWIKADGPIEYPKAEKE